MEHGRTYARRLPSTTFLTASPPPERKPRKLEWVSTTGLLRYAEQKADSGSHNDCCCKPQSPLKPSKKPSATGAKVKPRRMQRVPLGLQAVFLASNRGKEVHKPPPAREACKDFIRGLNFWKRDKISKKRNDSTPRFSRFSRSVARNSNSSNKSNTSSSPVPKEIKHAVRTQTAPTKPVTPEFVVPLLSPQVLLDAMIRARGYSTKTFNTKQTGYYNTPTDLQRASYHVHIIDIVRSGDHELFREVMASGVSLNPCNQYGESLVHTLARRGEAKLLQILVDLGCCLQLADDYGRTPLHDACWTAKPCFETIDIILKADRRLLYMADCHGALPLSYVRKANWNAWADFLESRKEVFWPHRAPELGEEEDPILALQAADFFPIEDPDNALSCELAVMVASGRMLPSEAQLLMYEGVDESDGSSDESDFGFDGSNSDFYEDASDVEAGDDVGQINEALEEASDLYFLRMHASSMSLNHRSLNTSQPLYFSPVKTRSTIPHGVAVRLMSDVTIGDV